MKKISGAALLFFLAVSSLMAQTQGTLSFSVTTTAPSSTKYSTSHLFAAWIENSAGDFIKTKLKYLNGDYVHMENWVNKSMLNVVDATTGATLTSYGTRTFLWNGTDVNSSVVTDGKYYVWLEMAWDDNLTTGKTVKSYAFTKGSTIFQSSPANTDNFLSTALTWTPLTTGLEPSLENNEIKIFPNPSSGLIKIDFRELSGECTIRVLDQSGKTAYHEKLGYINSGLRTLDLSSLKAGSYFCIFAFPGKEIVFNLVLVK